MGTHRPGTSTALDRANSRPERQVATDAAARIHASTQTGTTGSDQAALAAKLSDPNLTKAELDALTGLGYQTPGRQIR